VGLPQSLRQSAVAGHLNPLQVLATALCHWPSRRLSALCLHVLPELLDIASVRTKHGLVRMEHLDCSATPLQPHIVLSPLLKSLYCLMCCAVARAHSNHGEAVASLRIGTDVTRSAAAELGRTATASKIADAVPLLALFRTFVQALLTLAPAGELDTNEPHPVLVSAALLLRTLRVQAGTEEECTSTSDSLRRLEALSALA